MVDLEDDQPVVTTRQTVCKKIKALLRSMKNCFLLLFVLGSVGLIYVMWDDILTGRIPTVDVIVTDTWTSIGEYEEAMDNHNDTCTSDFEVFCPNTSWGTHRLGVIVPYRSDRAQLVQFVPHLHTFMNEQKIRHKFYIINQVDKLR